ncbi:RNA polymerase sigma factor [Marinoscillum sp.]|uniref:RNA polymerase sigma factor n=1 Tax=Marinoscillum sp. TaxID=2024838 RepID=UPI003BA936E5
MKPAVISMDQKNEHIERTVNTYRGKLLNFIRKFVPGSDDAEDVLQDVFYQFVVGYDRIESLDQISGWLFRVARNKATDNHRKMRPMAFSNMDLTQDDDGAPLMLEDILPDTSNLPDRELLGEMIWAKIEELLAQMPSKQREVFVWHEFEQKSFKEMAEETGETLNTMISRKRYAILALRVGLADLYKDLIND